MTRIGPEVAKTWFRQVTTITIIYRVYPARTADSSLGSGHGIPTEKIVPAIGYD